MHNELIDPYRVVYLDEIDSTNDEVRRHAELGADSGLWIVAGSQTHGRGRRGRTWQSAKGNFFGSLYIKLNCEPKVWSQLSFVAALAVREALEELSLSKGVGEGEASPKGDVCLKWPNDVLYNGKKVSGLLLESGTGTIIGGVILGFGINLAHAPELATDNMSYEATSFLEESGFLVLPNQLLPELTKCFDHYFNIWQSQGFKEIRNAWMAKASGIKARAKVQLPNETFEGIFLGLSDDGGARIELDDGSERIVLAGDIFPLL